MYMSHCCVPAVETKKLKYDEICLRLWGDYVISNDTDDDDNDDDDDDCYHTDKAK